MDEYNEKPSYHEFCSKFECEECPLQEECETVDIIADTCEHQWPYIKALH